MINRGAGSSWNLIWGTYKGATVSQYRILRGPSPESLQPVAEVSGSMTSYTDFTAPASGSLYYAVETVIDPVETMHSRSMLSRSASAGARSNVVAAAGGNVSLAQSVKVFSESGLTLIDAGDESARDNGLQLVALISPTTSTFASVNWVVTSGEDIVTVDQLGCVRATGKDNGTAMMRDGSGLYDEIAVTVNGVSGIYTAVADRAESEPLSVYPVPATIEFTVGNLPVEGGSLYIFSLGRQVMKQLQTTSDSETIHCENWPTGVYIVKSVSETGIDKTVKFTKK